MCGVLRERPGRRLYALFPRRVLLELRPPRERVPRLPRRDPAETTSLFVARVARVGSAARCGQALSKKATLA